MMMNCKKYNGCRLPVDLCNEDCVAFVDATGEYPYDDYEERKIEESDDEY